MIRLESSVKINTAVYGNDLSFEEIVNTKLIKRESLEKILKNWKEAVSIVALKIFIILINIFLSIFTFVLTNDNSIVLKYIPSFFLSAKIFLNQYNKIIPLLVCQIFSIILYLFFIPLQYGILRWFYLTSKYGKVEFTMIFYYYKSLKNFFKAFLFKIVMISRFLFFGSIFLLPGFSLFLFSCIKMQSVKESKKILFSLAIIGTVIFFICGAFLFIKFTAKYFLMPFLQVTNDENIFKNTKKVIKNINYNEDYFGKIFFSFFLLLPLQAIIFPMFFIFPYTTMIMFMALKEREKNNYFV